MIKSLSITDLATIEKMEIGLDRGFSVLTGETGAGKSIIIESIKLAMGEKGSLDVIRTGKEETSIEIVFSSSAPKKKDSSSGHDEDEILVQRRISRSRTGKSYLDGILVPLKKLQNIRDTWVDIYGQNDHAFLRLTENQLDYLDAFSDVLSLREETAAAAQSFRKLNQEKMKLLTDTQDRQRRQDYLRFQIGEIEKAELLPGEDQELLQERHLLKHAEKIGLWVDEALDLGLNRDGSLTELMGRIQSVVEKLAEFDQEFKTYGEAVGQFSISHREFCDTLIKFRESRTKSPERLEAVESRLSRIEDLKRKYGGSIADILKHLQKARAELESLETREETLEALEVERMAAFVRYQTLALELRERRQKQARELEKRIETEIQLLGMKKARLKIELALHDADPERPESVRDTGSEEAEFLLSPNPGEELKPLRKIASGGELSRLMLALKSLDREQRSGRTMIFDEIDAGIGGKTAELVAQKLNALSRVHQVLCITHLPQIASYAHHHFRIEKAVKRRRTYTTVKKLEFEERVEELARLLGGSHVTPTTLRNARELLERNRSDQSPT